MVLRCAEQAHFTDGAFRLPRRCSAVDGTLLVDERYERKELRVTHLNVGQGDAAVVELPGSKVLLIDAGGTASGDFDMGERIVAPYLRSRKILKVDYLFVTPSAHRSLRRHARDRRTSSRRENFGPARRKGQTSRFEDLEDALKKSQITRVALSDGEACRLVEQVRICCFIPPASEKADEKVRGDADGVRQVALSVRQRYRQARRNDCCCRKRGELRSAVLEGAAPWQCDGEHARNFSPQRSRRLAIISAGARSRSGSPTRGRLSSAISQIGAEVLRTYEDGAIIVESDGKTLRYRDIKAAKKA